MPETQCWWVRHAPIERPPGLGGYIGQTDVAARLPECACLWVPQDDARWFSSPLKRAQQTAKWLGSACVSVPAIETDAALMEQHFGQWEGRDYDEVWQESGQLYDWAKPWALRPPGGESFIDVCARVDGWLARTLPLYAGRHLVIVAHAGTIRAALRHALAASPEQALSYTIDNCSLTHVTYGEDQRARVNYVNKPLVSPAGTFP